MDKLELSDEELINLSKNNDVKAQEELVIRYKNLVKSIAHGFFLTDGDKEDLVQEGMMGLINAINTYKSLSPFKNYASLCIKSAIYDAIKKSNTNKQKALKNYISISDEDDKTDKNIIFIDVSNNPETGYIEKESKEELEEKIRSTLSKYEFEVLINYLQGFSYLEIGEKFNKSDKSIDNAIQRIRKKILTIK